eukprot:3611251-Rhodomonas_salina.1
MVYGVLYGAMPWQVLTCGMVLCHVWYGAMPCPVLTYGMVLLGAYGNRRCFARPPWLPGRKCTAKSKTKDHNLSTVCTAQEGYCI